MMPFLIWIPMFWSVFSSSFALKLSWAVLHTFLSHFKCSFFILVKILWCQEVILGQSTLNCLQMSTPCIPLLLEVDVVGRIEVVQSSEMDGCFSSAQNKFTSLSMVVISLLGWQRDPISHLHNCLLDCGCALEPNIFLAHKKMLGWDKKKVF